MYWLFFILLATCTWEDRFSYIELTLFYLPEHGFRFYASSSPVFQPFLGAEQLFGFLLVFPEPVVQFYRPVPFCLKHRHLSGHPSHLTALYTAFSLT